MNKVSYLSVLAILFLINFVPGNSQTHISGVINSYAKILTINNISQITVSISDSKLLHRNDTILIVQMKGADFETMSNDLGPTGIHTTGRYEFIGVESVDSTNGLITLRSNLINSYDVTQSVQLVKVKTYQSAVVTDTLTCYPWDGSKGGILALFVNDTLSIESVINVNGMGFRGADTTAYTGGCLQVTGRRNYSGSARDSAGLKGEGMIWSNFDLTRGYGGIANAGGGGDGEYSGGGGGAGYGYGGYGGQEATICSDPGTSTNSSSSGGEGGHSIKPDFGNETDSISRDRIFPGGGGGAGNGPNNSPGTFGGNGGGIVYIITQYLNTNGNKISSNGGSVSALATYSAGAGGGGGGGSVILATDNVIGSLNIQVIGGNGGSTLVCSGQGGGGGGGFFWTSSSSFNFSQISMNPGSAGTTIGGCPYTTTLPADTGSFATNLQPILNGFLFNIIGRDSTICWGASPNQIDGSQPRGGNNKYNYQWQSSLNDKNWVNISGANQKNYSSVPLIDTTFFRRIVTSLRFYGDPDSTDIVADTSKSIIINVIPGIKSYNLITPDTSVCYGQKPIIIKGEKPAGGDNSGHFAYRWQVRDTSSSIWTPVSGTDSIYSGNSDTTKYYKRIVQNNICNVSDSVKLTIYPLITNDSISASQTICQGTKPKAIINAKKLTGGDAIYSYLWQYSPDNVIWNTVPGQSDSLKYQPSALISTTYYRRMVYSGLRNTCKDSSNNILIAVVDTISNNNIQSDETICELTAPKRFTEKNPLSGGTGTFLYQWIRSYNNSSWDTLSAVSDSINYQSVPLDSAITTYFKRIVYSGLNNCCKDTSAKITISVQPSIQNNNIQNSNIITDTICQDQTPSRLIQNGNPPTGGNGIPYSYHWQYSYDNKTWDSIPGQSNTFYLPVALDTTTYFRRSVSSGACNDNYSNTVTVTVLDSIKDNVLTGINEVCVDSVPKTIVGKTVTGGQPPLYNYMWLDSSTAIGKWNTIPGETNANYPFTTILPETTYYRRIVTSGPHNCCISKSPPDTLYLIPHPISNGAGIDVIDTFKFMLQMNAPPVVMPSIGYWTVTKKGIVIVDSLDASTTVKNLDLGKNTLYWNVITKRVCNVITDSVTITVNDLIRYNGFSPNGDKYNQVFVFEGLQNVDPGTVSELKIFNRFGGLVFSSENYDNTWDGTGQNGQLLPSDTYFYVLKVSFVDARSRVYKGFVVLKR